MPRKLRPALIGGFIGSTLWQFAKVAYIKFQVLLVKYEVIYGALAQIPVLMVWLYVSWVIILLGAEIAYACNMPYFPRRFAAGSSRAYAPVASTYMREWLANTLYLSLLQNFRTGTGPWSAVDFAKTHRIPVRLVRDVTQTLVRARLIVEVAGAPEHYVPGCDPSQLTPGHILQVLRHAGDKGLAQAMQHNDSPATALMEQIEAASQQVAGRCRTVGTSGAGPR